MSDKEQKLVNAIGSVNRADLEEIPELCVVIERLSDSLRELRSAHPKKFFGHPVERLYAGLEAALDSFYRSKAESTPNEPPW